MKTSELVHTTRIYEVWDVDTMTVPNRWGGSHQFQPVEVHITKSIGGGQMEVIVSGTRLRRNGRPTRLHRTTGLFFDDTETEAWPAWLVELAAQD